jgi:hypothetical protein
LNKVVVTGVDGSCIGATLKLYFKIKTSGTIYVPASGYSLGDIVICDHGLTPSEPGLGANPESSTANSFAVSSTKSCSRTTSSGSVLSDIQLGNIGTRDLSDWVGFEIS